jgi:phosphoribosylamine---glycine ligase
MNILVVGGGGREHALVWKLRQSPRVDKIWCVPGNAGIAAQAECIVADPADVAALVALAERVKPDLTVVGPEAPLVAGMADAFAQRGWPIVAPTRQAAQLEGSKIFAKEFLERHQIPTAKMYGAYDTAKGARSALSGLRFPVVIKADGLCAGKGVLVAGNAEEASQFFESTLVKGEFGPGGQRLLLEEVLQGEELSFIIVTDGERYAPLVPTRDHKRVFEGDQGPNTGGMGAYSSDDLLSDANRHSVLQDVVEPTIQGLARDGVCYQGFLYFGLMLTDSGPKVLEFNCRLGDPETQAIVARMDFDLAEVLSDVAAGHLDPAKLRWKPGASVCVVLASGGYPGKFETGMPIHGLTDITGNTGVHVFNAGTKFKGDLVVTSGGRVLGATASGRSLEAALDSVYGAIARIRFERMHYRRDIGAQADRVRAAGD